MLKRVFSPALILLAAIPVASFGQAETPPPPGPYQAAPAPLPAMPAQMQMPQAAEPGQPMQQPQPAEPQPPVAPQPSAEQVWGQPPMLQLPYWMQAPAPAQGPGTGNFNNRQGGISPDASPDTRGGGQAPTPQLSPAGRAAAPANTAPAYGFQVTPGFFPGYPAGPNNAAQAGSGQVQMQGGGRADAGAQARGGAQPRPAYPAYPGYPQYQGYQGYPAYQGYPSFPGYQGFAPYPGQMPVPYWGAPVQPGYTGPVNR